MLSLPSSQFWSWDRETEEKGTRPLWISIHLSGGVNSPSTVQNLPWNVKGGGRKLQYLFRVCPLNFPIHFRKMWKITQKAISSVSLKTGCALKGLVCESQVSVTNLWRGFDALPSERKKHGGNLSDLERAAPRRLIHLQTFPFFPPPGCIFISPWLASIFDS